MSKLEKEKLKMVQEKCQSILTELLRDEDNKYCVDCDAKGPRWASWNLGIFLCIRCAGIHRNLGVHISKVKSVNLDAWTPHQVAYLQQMGNSKARAVYEANLPDNFRRPAADSALEGFIRSKYEQKKYIAKEWVQPPTPPPAFDIEEERKKEKEKKKHKMIKQGNSPIVDVQTNPVPRPHSSPAGTAINADKINSGEGKKSLDTTKPSNDLLGLDTPLSGDSLSNNSANEDDPFDAFVSAPMEKAPSVNENTTSSISPSAGLSGGTNGTTEKIKFSEEQEFFNQKAPEEKKLDKESILKLYESCSNLNTNPLSCLNTVTPQNSLFNNVNAPNLVQGFGGIPPQAQQQSTQGVPVLPGAFFSPGQSQPTYFPAATNPFLAANPTACPPTNFEQLQQQMTSQMTNLQLNPGFGANWAQPPNSNVPSTMGGVPQLLPGAGTMINPFVNSQPNQNVGFPTKNDNLVGNFFPPPTVDNSFQWTMNNGTTNPPLNPVAASNLWQ